MFKIVSLVALFATVAFSSTCDPIRNLCTASDLDCPSDSGNRVTINGVEVNFAGYDLISYGNLVIPDGDLEGRGAVRNDFIASTVKGVSIGFELTGNSGITYALIAGRDVQWSNGELYPADEKLFVGGTFTGASNLKSKVAGSCSSAGCLNTAFDNSQTYYSQVSSFLGSRPATATTSKLYGQLTISCSSSSAYYFVSIDGSDFSGVTSYAISSSCNSNAIFVFNIGGSSSVLFDGTPLEARNTIYNILGNDRDVYVRTFVYGSIINPRGNINQTTGTIFGWTVANNFPAIRQVNRPVCPGDQFPPTNTGSNTNANTGNTGNQATGSNTDGNTGNPGNTGVISGNTGNQATGNQATGSNTNGNTGNQATGNQATSSNTNGNTGVISGNTGATDGNTGNQATGSNTNGNTGVISGNQATGNQATGSNTDGNTGATGNQATGSNTNGNTGVISGNTGATDGNTGATGNQVTNGNTGVISGDNSATNANTGATGVVTTSDPAATTEGAVTGAITEAVGSGNEANNNEERGSGGGSKLGLILGLSIPIGLIVLGAVCVAALLARRRVRRQLASDQKPVMSM